MLLTALLLICMKKHNLVPKDSRESTQRCKDRGSLAYCHNSKPAKGFQTTDPNQTTLALAQ